MPDPQSLTAITICLSLAVLSAIGVWLLKGHRQRRYDPMSRAEIRDLAQAADDFETPSIRQGGP